MWVFYWNNSNEPSGIGPNGTSPTATRWMEEDDERKRRARYRVHHPSRSDGENRQRLCRKCYFISGRADRNDQGDIARLGPTQHCQRRTGKERARPSCLSEKIGDARIYYLSRRRQKVQDIEAPSNEHLRND